ncbi:hypothetical protein AGLY_011279 [Aphis glycines]|uniref:Uncharacterized protein n=1 Tax=Aphis glycines TaxID=307491 RepID=A0A6G0TF78_APHGL|nr:hypothetical protein AGLY_011279 [Aphis glycines]
MKCIKDLTIRKEHRYFQINNNHNEIREKYEKIDFVMKFFLELFFIIDYHVNTVSDNQYILMLWPCIMYRLYTSYLKDCISLHILIEKLFLFMELLAKNEKSIICKNRADENYKIMDRSRPKGLLFQQKSENGDYRVQSSNDKKIFKIILKSEFPTHVVLGKLRGFRDDFTVYDILYIPLDSEKVGLCYNDLNTEKLNLVQKMPI